MPASLVTSHILDQRLGRPAVGVAVEFEQLGADGQWRTLGRGTTNADGRLLDLVAAGELVAGRYRLHFATGPYFDGQQIEHFFPRVTVEFHVADPAQHYHIPLLLSPFGYSTYRGS